MKSSTLRVSRAEGVAATNGGCGPRRSGPERESRSQPDSRPRVSVVMGTCAIAPAIAWEYYPSIARSVKVPEAFPGRTFEVFVRDC